MTHVPYFIGAPVGDIPSLRPTSAKVLAGKIGLRQVSLALFFTLQPALGRRTESRSAETSGCRSFMDTRSGCLGILVPTIGG